MAEVLELINGSKTICHYTRFSEFSEPNCNGCNVGNRKMVELLHLFAENRLATGKRTSETTHLGTDDPGRDGAGRVANRMALYTFTMTSRRRSRVRKNFTDSARPKSFSRLRLLNNCAGLRVLVWATCRLFISCMRKV